MGSICGETTALLKGPLANGRVCGGAIASGGKGTCVAGTCVGAVVAVGFACGVAVAMGNGGAAAIGVAGASTAIAGAIGTASGAVVCVCVGTESAGIGVADVATGVDGVDGVDDVAGVDNAGGGVDAAGTGAPTLGALGLEVDIALGVAFVFGPAGCADDTNAASATGPGTDAPPPLHAARNGTSNDTQISKGRVRIPRASGLLFACDRKRRAMCGGARSLVFTRC